MKKREFNAIIKKSHGLDAAYIEVPFDIRAEYGKGRLKVHAVFDDIAHYDGSIVNMGVKNPDGSVCYIIGITKAIRARLGKQAGDRVRVTIMPQNNKITLRPFADNDIVLMERWLQMPHVAKWYKHPDHWLNELKERHGEFSFLTHFIAELDGMSIGFCQYYDTFYAQEHEVWNDEWQVCKQKGEIYSIDYLIGKTEYLGKGYGKQMAAELIKRIWKLGAKKIIVEPEIENKASSGILTANGFVFNGRDYILENPKAGWQK